MMVVDPDGVLVDIIERIPLTRVDLARLARYRREAASGGSSNGNDAQVGIRGG